MWTLIHVRQGPRPKASVARLVTSARPTSPAGPILGARFWRLGARTRQRVGTAGSDGGASPEMDDNPPGSAGDGADKQTRGLPPVPRLELAQSQSRCDASAAPSASACSFAHTTSSWQRPSGRGPDPGGFGHHPRLARPGRGVDYGEALAVGQHRQHSRGLIGSQLRTFGMMILNFLRASCQRVLKLSQFGAEGSRGAGARQARRDACAGLRDEAFLHGQLRAGGVPHAAVPLAFGRQRVSQSSGVRDYNRPGFDQQLTIPRQNDADEAWPSSWTAARHLVPREPTRPPARLETPQCTQKR